MQHLQTVQAVAWQQAHCKAQCKSLSTHVDVVKCSTVNLQSPDNLVDNLVVNFVCQKMIGHDQTCLVGLRSATIIINAMRQPHKLLCCMKGVTTHTRQLRPSLAIQTWQAMHDIEQHARHTCPEMLSWELLADLLPVPSSHLLLELLPAAQDWPALCCEEPCRPNTCHPFVHLSLIEFLNLLIQLDNHLSMHSEFHLNGFLQSLVEWLGH